MSVPVHSSASLIPPDHFLIPSNLDCINAELSTLSPQDILKWGLTHLDNLYQTTAFGVTGLAATDMLAKLSPSPPPLIFIDTLYHFPETLDLISEVREKYNSQVHIYKPDGCETVEAFESRHGENLWEIADVVYDYLVKVTWPHIAVSFYQADISCQVEPARRAYKELNVRSIITGRRASQGADRNQLQPLDIDSTGLIKLNPFFSWTFDQVKAYLDENHAPRNSLLDQGYRSVGDWHSTAKSGEGDDGERAGRWKGKGKTECGLHRDYFVMKRLMKENVRLQTCFYG